MVELLLYPSLGSTTLVMMLCAERRSFAGMEEADRPYLIPGRKMDRYP